MLPPSEADKRRRQIMRDAARAFMKVREASQLNFLPESIVSSYTVARRKVTRSVVRCCTVQHMFATLNSVAPRVRPA